MASNLLIPVKVDCFVLNEAVCSPPMPDAAKISPITQPNYSFLRYDNKYLASDILRHTDLHATGKASSNPRFTKLGKNEPFLNRQGVYVHWMIPRVYRSGSVNTHGGVVEKESASGTLAAKNTTTTTQGISSSADPAKPAPDLSAPTFPDVPTRWIVIRHLDQSTLTEDEKKALPELTGWVVESNHLRSIDEEFPEGFDLQTDVSPYVNPLGPKQPIDDGKTSDTDTDKINIETQAEVFIGSKWPVEPWREESRRRVPINLATSSNQLFADFQPHNGNVFSMIDTLDYEVGQKRVKIQKAKVSYYILGWHDDGKKDLFADKSTSRGERLKTYNMVLPDSGSPEVIKWCDDISPTRLLCHGANYDVLWTTSTEERPVIPADTCCRSLMSGSSLSVGTTPLDAILAYVHEHEGDSTKDLATALKNVEKMLIARDEGVEPQLRAADLVGNANYKRQEGGKHFYFGDTASGPAPSGLNNNRSRVPSDKEIACLRAFNRALSRLSSTAYLEGKLQWDMFSLWWSYLTDLGTNKSASKVKNEKNDVQQRFDTLQKLKLDIRVDKKNHIYDGVFSDNPPPDGETIKLRQNIFETAQEGVQSPFYQPGDPTLLLVGVPSGWPHDYRDKLKVRLDFQALGDPTKSVLPNERWQKFVEKVAAKLPTTELIQSARILFEEFAMLRPSPPVITAAGRHEPLYHDPEPPGDGQEPKVLRDRWNGVQPFFPLFYEWEVEYIHIPFKYWSLQEKAIGPNPPKWAYTVDVERFWKDTPPEKVDKRVLSGRSLILPQPGFSLESKIDALVSQVPEKTLKLILDKDTQKLIKTQLRKMQFLSSPLAGLTDHLLTRLHGSHVKPNNKAPMGSSIPIEGALVAAAGAEFKYENLKLIDTESTLTPYGSLVQYSGTDFPVFKPVTHGQIRFTKVNVIDKFGQAIHAISPYISNERPATKTCTSEYYTPQSIWGSVAPNGGLIPSKEYVQIPPQINQPARLNASFVRLTKPATGNLYWRPTTEWESPVWGWVVINHANYGLQFFLHDGTFYREVRVGGPHRSQATTEWLPFPAPEQSPFDDAATKQLQALIQKLQEKDGVYLQSFVDVIDDCMDTLLPAPAAYASQLGTVVGRPLALVNMGWSLELATEAYQTQILKGNTNVPMKLANPDALDDPEDPNKKTDMYSFKVKFGSREKQYDGLVGYFPAKKPSEVAQGDALELDTFYTYYGQSTPPLKSMETDPYRFFPYYFNPSKEGRSSEDFDVLHCKRQYVFGALIDPFASVHAYSSILPIRELTLPTWIWQKAFDRMTTFFTLGPLLMQKPVPSASASGQLKVTEIAEKKVGPAPTLSLPIPASTLGDWNWLQPYPNLDAGAGSGSDAKSPQRYYTRFKLDKVDSRARFEETPYTAVEGVLQLRGPPEKV